MSGISKRVSGSWVSGDYGIMKTATDTITTLPAVIYADGNNATVGLVGNMVQNGTPTPQNPIQPSECGDRTGNLFYKKISGANIDAQGKIIVNREFDIVVAKVTEGETYSVSGVSGVMGFYVNEPEVGSRSYNNTRDAIVSPVTIPQGVNYVAYRVSDRHNVAMLNSGETPLPYEPYGYKIPISSASTTTPVYLGEVQTTRKVKKLVLTGEESFWSEDGTIDIRSRYRILPTGADTVLRGNRDDLYCTHFKTDLQYSANSVVIYNGTIGVFIYFYIPTADYPTLADFKTYIQQQYANGTPVTIWYVLATETTGIVNEPIRKIGGYADAVSGITIPTIAGANSFDVLTTLKPSEVTVNYKGWHTGAVHERENGAWT